KLIRAQTGFEILYNSDMLENLPAITVEARDQPVQKLLDNSLKNLPLTYTILDDKTIVIRRRPESKQREQAGPLPVKKIELSGQVVDEQGKPIADASVLILGTRQGVLTDHEGKFSLVFQPEQGMDSIVVSFVGFESR